MTRSLLIFGICGMILYWGCTKDHPLGGAGQSTNSIAGTITDPDDHALEGAEVSLYKKRAEVNPGDTIQDDALKTTTDDDGFYCFDSVDEGDYSIKATYGDSLCKIDSVTVDPPSNRDDTTVIDLKLEVTAIIIGSFNHTFIDNSLNQNVTNVYVYNITTDQRSIVNNDGSFVLTNVPMGNYQLVVIRDGVVINSPLDTITIDITETDTTYEHDLGAAYGALALRCIFDDDDTGAISRFSDAVESIIVVIERDDMRDSFIVDYSEVNDSTVIVKIDSVVQDSFTGMEVVGIDDDGDSRYRGTSSESFVVDSSPDTIVIRLQSLDTAAGFSISITDTAVLKGARFSPKVIFDPEDADSEEMIFTSADTTILRVKGDSLIALKAGEVKVTATAGEASDDFKVTVIDNSFAISVTDITVPKGTRFVPKVTFTPTKADTQEVTFFSVDTMIVQVRGDSLVAMDTGKVKVTALAGGESDSFIVTVNELVITINVNNATIYLGAALKPAVTWSPTSAAAMGITLTSLNTDIVTIQGDSVVASTVGKAKVVAQVKNTAYVDTFEITVIDVPNNSQLDTVWFEDFERAGATDDWTADHGTWEAGVPTSGPGSAFEGNNVAATNLKGNYTEDVATRFIRIKSFKIPEAEKNPRLCLHQWTSFGVNDWGAVEIREVDSVGWKRVDDSLWFSGNTAGNWTRVQLDLSRFGGKEVQLSFYFKSSNSSGNSVGAGWYVDNIGLYTGTVIFNNPEGWETGAGAWTADHGIWEVGIPTSGVDSAYSGKNVLATILDGNYNEDQKTHFISPPFSIPSADKEPALRFRHWYSFGVNDYGYVLIRQVGATVWTILSEAYTGSGGGVWSYPFIDLKQYAGTAVQICFYFVSSNSSGNSTSSGWYIDDVVIQPVE